MSESDGVLFPALPQDRWLPEDPHDAVLLEQTGTIDRPLPGKPGQRYALVVVGGGSAGLVTAAAAASLGASVALIEERGLGGDCLHTGCVPSKALLAAAHRAHHVRTAGELGVHTGAVSVDFAAVMARMRRIRAELSPVDSVKRFTALGVDVYGGRGEFTGPDTVRVGARTLRFGRAVVATGGAAMVPEVPGLELTGYLTHETVFALESLPERLLVLGAGAIGCELAQAFARFGSEVTLLDRAPRVLPQVPADAAAVVAASLQADGVALHTSATIRRVVRTQSGVQVLVDDDGPPIEVDAVLVSTGRRPVVEGLGLSAAGVDFDRDRGVVVDDYLRTTNPRIYAAGDCATAERFTHMADAMARTVVQNALFVPSKKVSSLLVPRCAYTEPEAGHVGARALDLDREGVLYDTFSVPFSEVDRARLEGDARGFVKVRVQRGTDRVLGATVVGAGAGDLLGMLSLVMREGIGLGALSGAVWPYPTRAEVLRKVGDAWRRTTLSAGTKAVVGAWMRWR